MSTPNDAANVELVVLPLGVGDAFSQKYYSTSFLVGERQLSDGRIRWVLVDCPHPIRKILHEASQKVGFDVDVGDIDAVVLTHLHADHVSGLEDFAYFSLFALQKKVTLACHPVVQKRLWDGCLAAGMERLVGVGETQHKTLDDYFDVVDLDFDAAVDVGPFKVACRATQHHIPTTALTFASPSTSTSLGYSADTAFDLKLIDWLSTCSAFLHETNYGTHTPLDALIELPDDVRHKMGLVHYPDTHDVDAGPVRCAREGQLWTVTAEGFAAPKT